MTSAAKQSRPPVIGLMGGVASGKSFYARLFAAAGCVVIDADALVAEVYRDRGVLAELVGWWGPGVVTADGALDRKAVGKIVFADAGERKRLEELVHPRVSALREARTAEAKARVPAPRAVVWDIPLLVEVGLAGMCQRLVFVDTPEEVRVLRAAARNGWTREELLRRQAAQTPLETKRAMAHDVLDGLAGEAEAKAAVERVLGALG